MKKLLFSILLFSVFQILEINAQSYFEGYILYTYEYFDLDGKNISKQMYDLHPKEQHYYINMGNYVAFDHEQNLVQLYNAEGNQYFYKRGNDIFKLDAGDSSRKGNPHTAISKKSKILKYNCQAVEKDGNITFYSDKFKIDPEIFANHFLGDWNDYLHATKGALSLKSIKYYDEYYVELTATKIEPMKLNPERFQIEKILGIN